MSFVNVFMVKDDSVYFVRVHYRQLPELVSHPKKYLRNLRAKYLDAGYVLLDLNRKVLFNGQFATAKIPRQEGLMVLE